MSTDEFLNSYTLNNVIKTVTLKKHIWTELYRKRLNESFSGYYNPSELAFLIALRDATSFGWQGPSRVVYFKYGDKQ